MKLSCKEIQSLLIEAHHGATLSPQEESALKSHLSGCPSCRAFLQDLARLFEGIMADTTPALDDGAAREIREAVLRSLPSGEASPSLPDRLRGIIRNGPWHTFFVPALTGVCGIVLGFFITAAWLQHRPLRTEVARRAVPLTALVRQAPLSLESPPPLEVLENYVDMTDIYDSLDDTAMQATISQWADEFPEVLQEGSFNGTG